MDNAYKDTKMGEGLWRIEDGNVISYLIEGSERSVLIDAGVSGSDILGAAKKLTGKPISLICTHSDHDHIASAPQFNEVYLHPAEFERFLSQDITPVPMMPLWDNEKFDLGERSLKIIHIPGHTPGSIALLDEKARFLLVGDSVSDYGVWMFGEGRCFQAYICSIKRLISMKNEFDTLHSAHGSPSLDTAILEETLTAAEQMLQGKIEGVPPPGGSTHFKQYKTGRVSFMS